MQATPAKIAKFMSDNNYNKKQLAQELGVSQFLIYKLLSGERNPSLDLQIKFINRFGRDEAAKVFDGSPVLAVLETA